MVNLSFLPLRDSFFRFAGAEVLQLSVSSEAPTHSNSDAPEKLRKTEWLISAILREINQLGRIEEPAFVSYGFGGRAGLQAGVQTINHEGFSP